MSRFQYRPILTDPTISIFGDLSLTNEEDLELTTIWRESSGSSNKFDGKILYLKEHSDSSLIVEIGPYRYWRTQYDSKRIITKEPLIALAVNGIVRQGDKVLLGKRTKDVAQNTNLWDLVPSGGFSVENGGNWQAQLNEEIAEELSIELPDVKSLNLKGLLLDVKDWVADLMIEIEVEIPLENIEPRNNEISELFVADLHHCGIQDLSPSSDYIINLLKKESL